MSLTNVVLTVLFSYLAMQDLLGCVLFNVLLGGNKRNCILCVLTYVATYIYGSVL